MTLSLVLDSRGHRPTSRFTVTFYLYIAIVYSEKPLKVYTDCPKRFQNKDYKNTSAVVNLKWSDAETNQE